MPANWSVCGLPESNAVSFQLSGCRWNIEDLARQQSAHRRAMVPGTAVIRAGHFTAWRIQHVVGDQLFTWHAHPLKQQHYS
jgi:hypothetical protein